MLYISHSYGKGKCKYGVCGNLWYCMKALWEWKRAAVVMIALGFLPFLAASYGATLLPATIVNDLEAGRLFRVLALHIVVLCLFIWMGQTLDQSSMVWLERSMPGFLQHFRKKFTEKIMDLDYDFDQCCKEKVWGVLWREQPVCLKNRLYQHSGGRCIRRQGYPPV